MLFLAFSWLLLFLVSRRLGGWIFRRCRTEGTGPQTLFMGLAATASLCLLAAPWLPLRFFLPVLVLIACVPPYPRPRWTVASAWIWPFGLAACAALQTISSRDSISYHHDLVHILAEAGLPRGLAWIHDRFGFLSSWFALTACFDQPRLGVAGRADTAANGFLLGLCLCDLARSLHAWIDGKADDATRFAATGWLLALPLPVYLNFVASPTPDFPAIVYTLVFCRLLLQEPASPLPWVLAGLAFPIKLSTLPLLAVAALARPWRGGRVPLFLGIVPVLGWSASVWWASGYPLFPLSWSPATVAWQVPAAVPESLRDTIHAFAFWDQATEPANAARVYSMAWLRHWLSADPVNRLGGLAFAASVLLFPLLIASGAFRRQATRLLPPAVLGIAYLALLAPSPRFGLGYLVLLPAAALALWLPSGPFRLARPWAAAVLAVLPLLIVAPTFLRPTRSEARIARALREGTLRLEPQARLLRPPLVPHIRYDDDLDIALPADAERSHNHPRSTADRRATWYPFPPAAGGAFNGGTERP